MKSKLLFFAIGNIDDKFISEDAEAFSAGDKVKTSAPFYRNRNVYRFAGLAACAAAVLLCVWAIHGLFSSPNPIIDNPGIIYTDNPQGGGNTPTNPAVITPEIGLSILDDPVMPELRDEKLTLEEAQNDPDFGAYLPEGVPSKFAFESAQRFLNQEQNSLSASWNSKNDYISWSVSKATDYDHGLIVAASEFEKYDMSLYPIPLVESVPKELWEYVNNPVFLAEELTLDVVNARAIYAGNDRGDSSGWRIDFSVLYGDVVVRANIKGATPEQVWEMFAG